MTTETQDKTALVKRLMAAYNAHIKLFYANNAYSLSFGHSGHVNGNDMLDRYRETGLLDPSQLNLLVEVVEARNKVATMLGTLRKQVSQDLQSATQDVLKAFATDLGNDWYEFEDSTGKKHRALVRGFDSIYKVHDSESIAGSLRISPRGDGCSETWSFSLGDDKMTVHLYDGF